MKGLGGIMEERLDSRMKLRFSLRQLVKFTKMEKTERRIDFVGKNGEMSYIWIH